MTAIEELKKFLDDHQAKYPGIKLFAEDAAILELDKRLETIEKRQQHTQEWLAAHLCDNIAHPDSTKPTPDLEEMIKKIAYDFIYGGTDMDNKYIPFVEQILRDFAKEVLNSVK